MIDHRPHMLPKVRSEAIMRAMQHYPCNFRIASFIPGHQCAPQSTVVGVHLPVIGKGMSSKVTDMAVAAGCLHCHDLVDGRDGRIEYIIERYPAALHMRYLNALVETHAMLMRDLIIEIPDGELV